MRKFIVKHASYSTKQRMKEIQFWFIIRQLQQKPKQIKMAQDYEYYIDNIIENFCHLHNIKISTIKYAMAKAHHTHYKPDAIEIALATKYLNIPVRTATILGRIGNKKLYDSLEHYINKLKSPNLQAKFDIEVTIELEKFNRAYNKMFSKSQLISKLTEEIYDESLNPYTE